MKLLITSALVVGFILISCKKKSLPPMVDTDTIDPDTVNAMSDSGHIDTLVSTPKSDTPIMENDSAIVIK